ncbi:MAG: hypothetical protein OXI63_22355 [Candidatus Poribacteria bacterium]|nr:hypothetical protein [Candidatus Poribacteria bacterium]
MSYFELTLSVLGIVCLIFMIAVLWRFFEVLGLIGHILKRLRYHQNAIKDTMFQIRRFC